MTNIIVYTTPETLEHKKELYDSYWSLSIKPKKRLEPYKSKTYFATKGFIMGKFDICKILGQDIFFEDWKPLKKPVPQGQFQGFKYLEKNLG